MNSIWVVELYYQGKRNQTFRFLKRDEAFKFYETKLSACKLGLVGWSVAYPREAA